MKRLREVPFFLRRFRCWIRHPRSRINRFTNVTVVCDMEGFPRILSCKRCGDIIEVDIHTRSLIL